MSVELGGSVRPVLLLFHDPGLRREPREEFPGLIRRRRSLLGFWRLVGHVPGADQLRFRAAKASGLGFVTLDMPPLTGKAPGADLGFARPSSLGVHLGRERPEQ